MSIRTLFQSGYRAYIEENCDRQDLWFFLHIPKTAGSSFRAELARILKPDYNVNAYGEHAHGMTFQDRLEAAIGTFAAATRETRFRFASGHVPVEMMAPILNAAPTPKLFTMLRDPIARVVSDFRYQSTPQHPDHAAFRARCPSIEAYLEERGEWNKMTRYLAPDREATVEQTVNHVLDTFTFVGSMERYDASFRIMMDLLGADRAPSLFIRKTEAGQASEVARTLALDQRIAETNAKDVALYAAFMDRLRQIDTIMADRPVATENRAPPKGFSAWRDVG